MEDHRSKVSDIPLNNDDRECVQNNLCDVTDIPPKNLRISNLDIFFLVFSIATHITDIFIDINLVIQYHLHDRLDRFLYTIASLLVPSLIITLINLTMNQQDAQENKDSNPYKKKQISKLKQGCIFILTVLFQMTLTQRCCKNLSYALKSRKFEKDGDKVKQQQYFMKMIKGEEDISLLRVLECYIETAPQQILQLSLFIHDYHGKFNIVTIHQIFNIASSFILMAWSMACYHRSIRLPQWDKENITTTGMILQFLWHFFMTISRIAFICSIAVYSEDYAIVVCTIHWLLMTVWIITQSRGVVVFCQDPNRPPHLPRTLKEKISSILFSCILGFVYIFIYLNPEDCGTFRRYLFYYILGFIENTVASVLVLLILPASIPLWYNYFMAICCVIPYILGIIIMITYYLKFHPSLNHIKFSFENWLRK